MRRAEEVKLWPSLKTGRRDSPNIVTVEEVEIDLNEPCTILGGLNGAGKSRILRALADGLGDTGLLLNVHALCEQVLAVLRSRDDFGEMKDEFGTLGPDTKCRNDIERAVGREYDFVDWYALEIESSDATGAGLFSSSGGELLLPYFDVQYRKVRYSSREMGLGEFSVHLLFWILEQHRDESGLTLILDEPDAYLPPVGSSALLTRLLRVCRDRGWRLVVASHASTMIADALAHDAFVLLRVDDSGRTVAIHSRNDASVGDLLLGKPVVRRVLFVEDESAFVLTRTLVEQLGQRTLRETSIVWGDGSGYMSELQAHFPKPPEPAISFAYVFDGDKRSEISASRDRRWPVLFLPTDMDPDELFKSLRSNCADLAQRLRVPEVELQRRMDLLEGENPHDWVNELGDVYERQRVLRTLAELWVDQNQSLAVKFTDDLRKVL
ncbi:ATP-binding protein [Oerskovia enterophila]